MSDAAEGKRLRTPAAAEYLGIAASTLEKMGCAGTGPVFERIGPRAVTYTIPALEEYAAGRRATSTSEPPPPERREPTPGHANGAPVIARTVATKTVAPPSPARQTPRARRRPTGRAPPRRQK
jgi:hypothetical protein